MNIRQEHYPLTHLQSGIWYTEKLYPNTSIGSISSTLRIQEQIDSNIIEKSINKVLELNDSFKIRIDDGEDEPIQYISQYRYVKIDFFSFDSEEQLIKWCEQETLKPLTFINSDLFYFAIFQVKDKECGFYFKLHHLISDGWTATHMVNQIVKYCGNYINNTDFEFEAKPSYVEYIDDEVKYLSSKRFERDKEFWDSKFSTIPELTRLKMINANLYTESKRKSFLVNKDVALPIREFCEERKISIFIFFLSILSVYINRVTSRDDITIGSPVLNRTNAREKDMTGMFVCSAPVRLKIDTTSDFETLLKTITSEWMSVLRHYKYPYNNLIKDVREKDKTVEKLFDIVLSFQNAVLDKSHHIKDFSAEWLFNGHQTDSLCLHINEREGNSDFELDFDYMCEVFSEGDIEDIHRRLMILVQDAIKNPQEEILKLDILGSDEKQKVLYEFNNTKIDYSREKTIHRMIEEQVKIKSNNTAIIFEGKHLTYGELNEKANQLARVLIKKGLKTENVVAIMSTRSFELIIGILAIIKTGGAFLPLDPENPNERNEFMLQDSKAVMLLTQGDLNGKIKFAGQIIEIDSNDIYTGDKSDLCQDVKSDNLAYIIYTSGSTGSPKGVMVEHKSLNNFTEGVSRILLYSPDTTVISIATISFDVFVFETLTSLAKGIKIVLANESQQKIPSMMGELIANNNVDKIYVTPSKIKLLIDDKECANSFKILKEIVIGGEVLALKLVEELKKLTTAKIFNAYGPTETTIGVTLKELTSVTDVNIGRPTANSKIYILNQQLSLLPIGVTGEICIGGEGLGRGYLNRPELTNEKFITNPLKTGERLYKTGDLAKWLYNGDIEYIGRIDSQVKIRGFRIELSEIESRLLSYNGVKQAIVINKEDSGGKKYLCAYLLMDSKLSVPEVRDFLSKRIPSYMIPTYFIQINEVHLNANGKIIRTGLPEPDNNAGAGSEFLLPTNDLQAKLVEMLLTVLQVEKIGTNDNFFELGADSLCLVSLISGIHKEFGVIVPFVEIYKSPTIGDLEKYINNAQKSEYTSIQPVEEQEYYPMSSAQRRLYTLMLLEDVGVAYNTPGVMIIEGNIDKLRFENAWIELIKRHDALRTSFEIINEKPVQRIWENVDFKIDYRVAGEEEAKEITEAFFNPFDMAKAPLLRVGLIAISKSKHILLFDMHHIICDGASVKTLFVELNKLYQGEVIPPLKIQYKDYSNWQKNMSESEFIKRQEQYWLRVFSGETPALNMPYDYPRPTVHSSQGGIVSFEIDSDLTGKIKQLSYESDATLFMVLLAAYNVLLSKYTGQEDIIVGTPVEGRNHADLDNIIGMFVNTLAMRNYPTSDEKFNEFLYQVRENAISAFENQEYQFEELVTSLKIKRDISRNPIFDTMFVLQNVDASDIKIGNLNIIPRKHHNKNAKFDILVEASERNNNICFDIEYSTKLFNEATIKRMIGHYVNILSEITKDSSIRIKDIKIITEKEENQLLNEFNETEANCATNKTVHQLFEVQAEKTPNTVAVVFDGKLLTYNELNEKSNQLARVLQKEGIESNNIVGLAVSRSLEMVIGVMGILKAGGAVLPIDLDYPKNRIEYMLSDSRVSVLITDEELDKSIKYNGRKINILNDKILSESTSNLALVNDSESMIYVIYTSGSTGDPKGVIIQHKNIANLMNYQFMETNIDFCSKVLQFTTISFDVCFQEIFSTLLVGGELHIASNEIKMDALKLIRFIYENRLNIIFLPPSYLKIIINEKLLDLLPRTIKHIIVAGEQLIITGKLKIYLQERKVFLHNHYGPSETHVVTTFTVFPDETIPFLPPIGRPISNTKVYVVDTNMRLVPIGVIGELCITGESLGLGYFNRPELTSKKFISNPFAPDEKMYRTGDLVRWLPDGNLEFSGRIDHQVKIRGFRIELDEIESQLLQHKSIKEVVVVAKADINGKKYLCAYIVSEKDLNINEIKRFLSQKLPDYMIPAFFIKIEKLPLTPSGKIDRNALPEKIEDIGENYEFIAPRDDVEKKLVEIWSKVLALEKISVNDNFFELGGDSLSIIQAQINAFPYNWGLSTQDFYQHQTIGELAEMIHKSFDKEVESTQDLDTSKGASRLNQVVVSEEVYSDEVHFKNVFLTGATGFLGSHILNEILTTTDATIYCLVRAESQKTAETRLLELLDFYFSDRHHKCVGKRIIVIKGDLTSSKFGLQKETYENLGRNIDLFINAAALVKHYGNYSEFERINVFGTQEAIDFCVEFRIPLNHISTIGISGNINQEDFDKGKSVLTENDFYVGQDYSQNVYIRSKFEAESLVYKAMSNGLVAKVFRIGNLTGRYTDGHFQKNISNNAFYNRIKSIIKLGVASKESIEFSIELTPVDYCSQAIMQLIKHGCGSVYHIFNHNYITLKEMLEIFGTQHFVVKVLDYNDFSEFIKVIARDSEKMEALTGIIQDFDSQKRLNYEKTVIVDSKITIESLKKLNFLWPNIHSEYIMKLIKHMKQVKFL